MQTKIEKLTKDFAHSVVRIIANAVSSNGVATAVSPAAANATPKPRGMAALSAEERSVVATKAALTRKRRKAARKAVETKKRLAAEKLAQTAKATPTKKTTKAA